ncbi:hypothetical protein IE077_000687 [Cardiosporidium cionae]|uniref:XPA C-terminal domain-containing protein n=1 Tax=Cardiosporidium cionae TaxID=476202 RepID=A0ABQ7JGD5_9APIC|nr:hypothetical protein IE077_000687 [Cardiosporidium cionae]|eukprot:KAF8823088.1 hypothetical protein IE077_000687 [Cardiosporidium cionae]
MRIVYASWNHNMTGNRTRKFMEQRDISVPTVSNASLFDASLLSLHICAEGSAKKEEDDEAVTNIEVALTCRHCGSMKQLDRSLLQCGIGVCWECLRSESLREAYSRISQTNALRKYCLSSNDLVKATSKLAVSNVRNPRGYEKQMKLYYEFQLRDLAIQKYGSWEEVEKIHDNRQQHRFSRILAPSSEFTSELEKMSKRKSQEKKSKMGKKRTHPISQIPNRAPHIHQFEEARCTDATRKSFVQKCITCDFMHEWEEI